MIRHFLCFSQYIAEEDIEEITFLRAFVSYFYPIELFNSLKCCILVNGLVVGDTIDLAKRLYFFTKNLNGYWQNWNCADGKTKSLLKHFLTKGYFGRGGTCVPGMFSGRFVLWCRNTEDDKIEFLFLEDGKFKTSITDINFLSFNDEFFIMEFPYKMISLEFACSKALFFSKQWWKNSQLIHGKEYTFRIWEDRVFLYTLKQLSKLGEELNKVIKSILERDSISVSEVLDILYILSEKLKL